MKYEMPELRFTKGELNAILVSLDEMTREINCVTFECDVDKQCFKQARAKLMFEYELIAGHAWHVQ